MNTLTWQMHTSDWFTYIINLLYLISFLRISHGPWILDLGIMDCQVLWVELGPQKDMLKSSLLGPMNVNLFGNKMFLDVLKFRWSYTGLVWDLIEWEKSGHRETDMEGRWPCDNRVWDLAMKLQDEE